jgi:hypothetical protein
VKYNRLCFLLSLLLIFVIATGCSGKTIPTPSGDNQAPAKSVNEPALPDGYVVLDRQTGDIAGDGKPKDILLVGRKPDTNSNFADDLSIVVRAGASENAVTVKLPKVGGYDGKLFIGDFSGDKVNDVLVTITTGGSGGIIEHRIVTFVGEPKIIFGAEENKGIAITGRFIDGFKFELTEETTKRKAIVDLAYKKDIYIKANLYDAGGTLLRQQSGWVNPFGELNPVDIDRDGTYELRGQQRVAGLYNADTVASIFSIWKYENQKWTAKQIEVSSLLLGYGEK